MRPLEIMRILEGRGEGEACVQNVILGEVAFTICPISHLLSTLGNKPEFFVAPII